MTNRNVRRALCVVLALLVGWVLAASCFAETHEPRHNEAVAAPTDTQTDSSLLVDAPTTRQGQADEAARQSGGLEHADTEKFREEALREIPRLRRKLGMSPLRGSLLDPGTSSETAASANRETPDEFAEALGRVAAALVFSRSDPGQADESSSAMVRDAQRSDRLVRALRKAATALDCCADQFEWRQGYERADQLRQLANQLRQEARELSQPACASRQ